MMTKVFVMIGCSWWYGGGMSYALPPRDNRRRTSRSHGVAMHDSFPSEELLGSSDKSESPILRSDDDDNSIAKPIDDDDDAANDDEKIFSMSNRRRLATRDDINNDCEVDDYAQQLPDTASGQNIEQYGSLHEKWILSSVVGVAIIGVSMIDGADRQVVFTIVCILAIIVIRNSLNKLIHQHHDDSRLSSIASSLSENQGLYSRLGGRSSSNSSCQSSPPRLTFEFGLRNNAPSHSSSSSSSSHHHKNWRQVKTMTNNIKSADSPLLKKKSSSIVRPKALAQLLEERKSSSSSILFASDSITIKPPMQTLERLEKRDRTIMRDEHEQ